MNQCGPLGDEAVERFQAGGDVVVRVDRLAHVVQQRREQELLVVGQRVAGQVEDLQAVIEGVAFGMVLQVLLHVLQRQEQALIDLEAIDLLGGRGDGGFEVEVGILARRGTARARRCWPARSALPVIELLKT